MLTSHDFQSLQFPMAVCKVAQAAIRDCKEKLAILGISGRSLSDLQALGSPT